MTKGDANDDSIPGVDYPIKQGNYVGKVLYVIPKLGLLTKAISPPVNYILISIIIVILFFLVKPGRKENSKKRYKIYYFARRIS